MVEEQGLMTDPRIEVDLYWLPLGAGETWTSNSVISRLLAASGLPAGEVEPPMNGRVPGWHAEVVVARRGQSVA
jgi:hypothetical protein